MEDETKYGPPTEAKNVTPEAVEALQNAAELSILQYLTTDEAESMLYQLAGSGWSLARNVPGEEGEIENLTEDPFVATLRAIAAVGAMMRQEQRAFFAVAKLVKSPERSRALAASKALEADFDRLTRKLEELGWKGGSQ